MTIKKLTVTILACTFLPLLACTFLLILASTLLPLPVFAQKDNLFPAKDWINFQWEEVTIAGTHFDKAAMLVPTRIESLPYAFTLELDLGATSTMLYGNTLIPYMKLSPTLPGKLDTSTKRFRIEGQMNGGFRSSLGAPFFTGKVLIIDYPNHRLVFFVSGFDDFYKDENILGLTGNAFFLNDIIAIDFKNDRFGILK